MGFIKDEIIPTDKMIEIVVEKEVKPILSKLKKETKENLSSILEIWAKGEIHDQLNIPVQKMSKFEPKGSMRLYFEKTFRENIYIYYCEAIFRGVEIESGFSGFSTKGKITKENERFQIESKGLTIRYNNHDWSRG